MPFHFEIRVTSKPTTPVPFLVSGIRNNFGGALLLELKKLCLG
jgi:hypothetical protein